MSRAIPTFDEHEKIARLRELLAVAKSRGDARKPATAAAIREAEHDLAEYEAEMDAGESDE